MRRVVSVWLPRFATDRMANRPGAGRGDPLAPPPRAAPKAIPAATVTQARGAWRLAAVNAAAARMGLTPGLSLADARAQVPALDTIPADPAADARALTRLARWAGRYTPWTAVDASAPEDAGIPGAGLWLDVTGCAHLFGGEDALLADLSRRLDAAGYTARAGLAATPGAAWALARFDDSKQAPRPWRAIAAGAEKDSLAGLPMAALRLPSETTEALARLGLRRVGDLYPLTRASLALRFGLEPCLRLDQALGDRDEPLSPLSPPPLFQVRLNFPEPVGRADDIALALDRLLAALAPRLSRAGKGARRLDFTLFRVDGTTASIRVGTGRASRDTAHLAGLFRDKLDGLDPGFGIETALLAARAVDPLPPGQDSLPATAAPTGGPRGNPDRQLDRLIDRLANRLGPGGLVALHPRASHLPERAQELGPPDHGKRPPAPTTPPSTAAATAPRPIHLLPQPEPVDALTPGVLGPPAAFRWRRRQHRVVHADGPERIAPEWWRDLLGPGDGPGGGPDGDPDAGADAAETRDYYRVEDETGARFWLFRTGRPLPGRAPQWFLHGVFP